MRQFVQCTYKPGEGLPYTFHHEGLELSIGDRVRVPSRHGTATVHVCNLDAPEPDFPTKGIIERIDDEPEFA